MSGTPIVDDLSDGVERPKLANTSRCRLDSRPRNRLDDIFSRKPWGGGCIFWCRQAGLRTVASLRYSSVMLMRGRSCGTCRDPWKPLRSPCLPASPLPRCRLARWFPPHLWCRRF